MRSIKIIISLSMILMLCIAALTTQAAHTEKVSDPNADDPGLKLSEQFNRPSKLYYQPAFLRVDRHAPFKKNTGMDSIGFGINPNTLFREAVHSSVDDPGFNERFFMYRVDNRIGIEREMAFSVPGDLLFQQTANEDSNGELWGWYAVGAVSAFLITGTLIYFLSGDSGTPAIPEPPGRP